MDDDGTFLREVETGDARFKVSTRAVAADLSATFGRIRQPVHQWPWPARLDHALGTRPVFEILVEGPRGDVRGWLKSLRQLAGNFLTPRGRAWLRWHWDHVHNDDRRPELLRKLNAQSRLARIKSRYWETNWYLADE
jgi:hypothetical protein